MFKECDIVKLLNINRVTWIGHLVRINDDWKIMFLRISGSLKLGRRSKTHERDVWRKFLRRLGPKSGCHCRCNDDDLRKEQARHNTGTSTANHYAAYQELSTLVKILYSRNDLAK